MSHRMSLKGEYEDTRRADRLSFSQDNAAIRAALQAQRDKRNATLKTMADERRALKEKKAAAVKEAKEKEEAELRQTWAKRTAMKEAEEAKKYEELGAEARRKLEMVYKEAEYVVSVKEDELARFEQKHIAKATSAGGQVDKALDAEHKRLLAKVANAQKVMAAAQANFEGFDPKAAYYARRAGMSTTDSTE